MLLQSVLRAAIGAELERPGSNPALAPPLLGHTRRLLQAGHQPQHQSEQMC
jgi:hypothetical protein